MPVLNGIEATKKVREYLKLRNKREHPIIIGVTGHVQESF